MQKTWFALFLIIGMLSLQLPSNQLSAAGLDELSKKPTTTTTPAAASTPTKGATPEVKPAVEKPAIPSPAKPPVPVKQKTESQKDEDEEPSEPSEAEQKTEAKPMVRSAASKALENRLFMGTSLGWALVKPSKGTWIGIGAADTYFRWRASSNEDAPVYITGRYAPVAGVWSTGNRDYDTTLHGIYAGAEYVLPLRLASNFSLKASSELGYMLVYAKAQDGAPESSDVKKGTLNLSVGGGGDWSLFSNKLKLGPFVRLHAVGFNMVNVGASAQFVF